MEPDGLVLPGRESGLVLPGDHSPIVVILILTLKVCRAVSFVDLDVFPGVVVNIQVMEFREILIVLMHEILWQEIYRQSYLDCTERILT